MVVGRTAVLDGSVGWGNSSAAGRMADGYGSHPGDELFGAVVSIAMTIGFAVALTQWPSDVRPPRVLITIFAVYSLLMIGIWVLIRR